MIEVFAVMFSLLSVLLAIRNNILTWPVGIIGIILYFLVFKENGIVGNQYLQILFILQSIHGWYNWGKSRILYYPLKISWLSNYNRFNFIVAFSIIFIVLSCMLPFFDSITTSLSIIGILLLSYKKIDTWIYWIVADLLYVWFFIDEGLYLSAVLYFIFFGLAIVGLIEWKKIIKDEKI